MIGSRMPWGVRILRRNKANCDIIRLAPGFSGWAGVITAIVGMVILVVVFVFHRDELSEYGISMGAASAVGVVYFLWSCPVTYRVDFSGITKRRCGIPVRFVAWEQISQIGHAQLGKGACLFVPKGRFRILLGRELLDPTHAENTMYPERKSRYPDHREILWRSGL